MQAIIDTKPSAASGSVKKIKLSPLAVEDVKKLDYLFSYMKKRPTESVDIYSVCKKKWGDNKLLYIFFAEYLKNNYFTEAQSQAGNLHPEYAWKHKITPQGLMIDGFKNEYMRQYKVKRKEPIVSFSLYKRMLKVYYKRVLHKRRVLQGF